MGSVHPAAAGTVSGEPSLSLGGVAGSIAGVTSGVLQQLGSVTSKTSGSTAAAAAGAAGGGLLGGIDWAAIKNEALKAAPAPPPAAAAAGGKPKAAAAAGGGGGTGDDDAPYNPLEDDEQPYDPTEGYQEAPPPPPPPPPPPAAAAAGGTGGSSDPTAAGFADVPDILPVVAARPSSLPPGPGPCQLTWHGCFVVPSGSFFSAHVQHLGGSGEVGRMLGPPGSNVNILGRVALDKFEGFARELRSSRSRTISLGLVVVAPGAPASEAGYLAELLEGYSSKGRIGKLALSKEVEGYLVARSGEREGRGQGEGGGVWVDGWWHRTCVCVCDMRSLVGVSKTP